MVDMVMHNPYCILRINNYLNKQWRNNSKGCRSNKTHINKTTPTRTMSRPGTAPLSKPLP